MLVFVAISVYLYGPNVNVDVNLIVIITSETFGQYIAEFLILIYVSKLGRQISKLHVKFASYMFYFCACLV